MSEATQPRAMSFFAAAGLTIAARLVVDLVRELSEAARPGAVADVVTYAAAFAIAHLLFVFVIVRVWAPETSLRVVLGLRPPPIVPTVFAPLAGAAMYAPLARLDDLISRRFPSSTEEQQMAEKLLDTSTVGARAGLLIALVLVVPIVTELFFRGAIYGRLRRERSEGLAVFATTAFFVLASFDPRTMASTLALGAALGWLRARTGSAVPAILAHVAFFSVPVVPILFGQAIKEDSSWSSRWVVGGAAVALVALLVALASASASASCRALRAQDA